MFPKERATFKFEHTGLGEEGTKALVGIGSFALFGQESIGLGSNHVLVSQFVFTSTPLKSWLNDRLTWIPCSRQYSYCTLSLSPFDPNPTGYSKRQHDIPTGIKLTSQHELAI